MIRNDIDSGKWTRNKLLDLSLYELRQILILNEAKTRKDNKLISLIKRVIHYKQLPENRMDVPRRTLGKQERIL